MNFCNAIGYSSCNMKKINKPRMLPAYKLSFEDHETNKM